MNLKAAWCHFLALMRRPDFESRGGGEPARKCQVIRILRLQHSWREGSGGTEYKNISKCKSCLMSSPQHNLMKSTYERTSGLYNIRTAVGVISFTDWRYIPVCEEIRPGETNVWQRSVTRQKTNQTERVCFEGERCGEASCLMRELTDSGVQLLNRRMMKGNCVLFFFVGLIPIVISRALNPRRFISYCFHSFYFTQKAVFS